MSLRRAGIPGVALAAGVFAAAITGAAAPVLARTPVEVREEGDSALFRGDYGMAVQWYKAAAGEGDTPAQAMLGWLFRDGRGVAQSFELALYWFRRAAEQHNAGAAFGLGTMYEKGRGVPASYAEAARWYRTAAEQGHAGAQNNLGWYYQNGFGVPLDPAMAAHWYRLAVLQGQPDAHGNLGLLYISGLGVPQNLAEGERLLAFAATNGDKDAAALLARIQAQNPQVQSPPAQGSGGAANASPPEDTASAAPSRPAPRRSVTAPTTTQRPPPQSSPRSVLGLWHPKVPVRDEGLRQMYISLDIQNDLVVFQFSCRYLDGSILSGSFATQARIQGGTIQILENGKSVASNDEHICRASMTPASLPYVLEKDDLTVTFDGKAVNLHRAGRG